MTEIPPAAEIPRAYGADRLESAGASERVLLCPVAKAWTARRERTLTTAEHPGTAVSWGDAIFEVAAAEPLGGGTIRYRLVPWRDELAIRRMEHYDAENEAARAAERRDQARRVGARGLSIALAPLAGLLPGRVQERMESEVGAPAAAMTVASAAPLLLLGAWGLVERAVGGQLGGGPELPDWLLPSMPVAMYLVGESALRLASAVAMARPMGSLPVVLAWEAWGAIRGAPAERRGTRLPAESDADRYRMVEPFLALLTPEEQSRLEERFGFDPVRWGKITAALILLVCGSNALAAAVNAAVGRGTLVDAAWLVGGTLLSIEQIARWRRLRDRRPAGSVLGALVRPLARRLLRVSSQDPRGT
jgi:hypothetical protein